MVHGESKVKGPKWHKVPDSFLQASVAMCQSCRGAAIEGCSAHHAFCTSKTWGQVPHDLDIAPSLLLLFSLMSHKT